MTQDLDKLADIVRDGLPAIEAGLVTYMSFKVSAHEKVKLNETVQLARQLSKGPYPPLGIITLYEKMAGLTPILSHGLQDGKVRSELRSKGYVNFRTAWFTVFSDFGMSGVNATTGQPVWSRITSC